MHRQSIVQLIVSGNSDCFNKQKLNQQLLPVATFVLFVLIQTSDSLIRHTKPVKYTHGNLIKSDEIQPEPCPRTASLLYGTTCIMCLENTVQLMRNNSAYFMCCRTPESVEKVKINEGKLILNGKTLQMITVIRPPFVRIQKGVYSGVVIEVLNAMQEKYNFSRIIHLREDNQWGSILPNGSVSGMLGQVVNREVDVGITGFSVIYDRSKVIDFSMAFHQEPTAILIPAPKEGNKLTILIRPFQFEVWLTVFATIFVLGPSLYALHIASLQIRGELDKNEASRQRLNGPELICDLFQFIIGSLVQEGLKSPVQKTTKCLVILWWFFTLVLANIYTGYMVSYLSAPKLHDIVDDLEGLVSQQQLKWTYRKNTAIESLMKSSVSGIYRKVKLGVTETDLVTTDDAGVNQTTLGKYAFLKEKSFLDVALSEDFIQNRKCRMTTAKRTFFTAGLAMILQKGSVYLELFDFEIVNSLTSGLMQKWKDLHWPKHLECEHAASYILRTTPKTRKLTMDDCQGANFLLLCGWSLASIAFIKEIFCTLGKRLWKMRSSLSSLVATVRNSQHQSQNPPKTKNKGSVQLDNMEIFKIVIIPVKGAYYEKMNCVK